MNRSQLINKIAQDTGFSSAAVTIMLDSMVENIVEALAEDDNVVIQNLGRFEMRHRKPHHYTNPLTGEKRVLASKSTPGFSASNTLKKRLEIKEEAEGN